jgi:hypothetical protein
VVIGSALLDEDGTVLDSRAAVLAAWRESSEVVIRRKFPATPT